MVSACSHRRLATGVTGVVMQLGADVHAEPAVVVSAPEVEGRVPAAWPAKVRGRLVDALGAGGLEVAVDGEGGAIDVDSSLRADLSLRATGRDFDLELTVVEVGSGEVVATATATCDTCGFAELGDSVEAVATSVVRALARDETIPARVTVTSTPAGAEVTIDGESVGETPVELTVAAGQHELTVAGKGHVPHRRPLEVGAGEVHAIELALAPVAASSSADVDAERSRRVRLGAGSAAVVAGVSGVTAGIVLLAMHGKPVMRDCAGGDVDADGDCRFLHDTRAWGAVGVGIGAAAVVAGATVLGLTLAKDRNHELRAALSPRGLSLRGRF